MKRPFISTLLAAICMLGVSCSNRTTSTQPAPRDMESIFTETISVMQDTTSSFSGVRAEALLNELADTLQSVMDNSEFEDVRMRMTAQYMALAATEMAFARAAEEDLNIEDVALKFHKVISTWRTQESEKGFGYLKEILFYARKDTPEEELRDMYIISRTTVHPRTVVRLPIEAAEDMCVLFADKTDGEAGYDLDNAASLQPDRYETEEEFVDCLFEGTSFMDEMKSHDALFIFYLDKDGNGENVMLNLGELHKMVKE